MADEHLDPGGEVHLGGHPKGTMAIVGLYGLLFISGWLVIYFFVFIPRGTMGP